MVKDKYLFELKNAKNEMTNKIAALQDVIVNESFSTEPIAA